MTVVTEFCGIVVQGTGCEYRDTNQIEIFVNSEINSFGRICWSWKGPKMTSLWWGPTVRVDRLSLSHRQEMTCVGRTYGGAPTSVDEVVPDPPCWDVGHRDTVQGQVSLTEGTNLTHPSRRIPGQTPCACSLLGRRTPLNHDHEGGAKCPRKWPQGQEKGVEAWPLGRVERRRGDGGCRRGEHDAPHCWCQYVEWEAHGVIGDIHAPTSQTWPLHANGQCSGLDRQRHPPLEASVIGDICCRWWLWLA